MQPTPCSCDTPQASSIAAIKADEASSHSQRAAAELAAAERKSTARVEEVQSASLKTVAAERCHADRLE